MNPKKAVKELEKQLRKDPHNLVLRIRLAAALHAAGDFFGAVELYRSVALAYYQQQRIDQAIAVCHSLLEIAPDHHDTRMLLVELDARKLQAAAHAPPPPREETRETPYQSPQRRQHSGAHAMTPTPSSPSHTSGNFRRSSVFDSTGSIPRLTPTPRTPTAAQAPADARQRERRPSGFEADPFTPGSEPDMLGTGRGRAGGRARGDSRPNMHRTGPGNRTPSGKRFPLPLMRTMNGPGTTPPIDPSRPRGDSMPPTAAGRPRSGSGSPDGRDVDEDAATRIAWPGEQGSMGEGGTGELPTIPPRSVMTPPRGAPPASRPPPVRGAPSPTRPPQQQPPPRRAAPSRPPPAQGRPPTPSRPPPSPERVPSRPMPAQGRPAPTPSRPPPPRGGRITAEGVVPAGRPSLMRASTPPPGRMPSDTGETDRFPQEPTVTDDNLDLQRAFGQSPTRAGLDPVTAPAQFALLSALPQPAVEMISAAVVRRRIGSGEVVLREGDVGDSCYLVGHGEVRVLKRDPLDPRGELMEVSRLGEGELFGEIALLSDRRRHATVQAVSDSEVLEIPRSVLREVASHFPEVDVFLQKFYRDRIISTLVSTAPFFRPLEPPQRTGLIAHFQFTRAENGQNIIVEGERSGCFYLIVLGTVDITKRVSDKRQVLLATLGEGSYFGEMSLLRGDVARASVTATGPTELAVLPAKNFYALVASHPILWDQVRQEAHRRELELVQLVTGVTGSV